MFRRAIITALLSSAIISTGALAGEVIKFKSHNNNVTTKWESSEMGDEPGHIRGAFELKGVVIRYVGPSEPPYKIDCWGVGEYWKDGTGTDRGYCKYTFADGSYYYEEWTGKAANGHDVGTGVFYGGSGRFKGIKGGEKYDNTLMGDRGVVEVEGTIELP
jgi:hypothetical protein